MGHNEMERTAAVPEDLTGRPRRVATGGVSWRKTFSAFRYRNYRLYFCGQLVSLIGTWMTSTAQGWLVYQLTGSKALLGIVAAAGTAPMLVFATWGGWAADHFPKRSVLVCTQIAMMISAFIFAGLIWSRFIQPWQIIVLGLCGGVVMAFDMPARQSFVVEIASREDLMNAISLNSAMFNGARIIGPAIAGFLMAKVGIALCFFIDGVSFLAVLAGLLLMRLPPHIPNRASGGPLAQSLEGFRYVWQHVRVRTIFALFAIVGIFGWSYSVLMPAFARDVLHLSEQGYGFLLGASGVGALIGAFTTATFGSNLPAQTGVRRSLALLRDAFDLCLQSQPDHCHHLPRRLRIWDDALLFHLQHHRADDCAGRNARTGHGNMGVDFRRNDSVRQRWKRARLLITSGPPRPRRSARCICAVAAFCHAHDRAPARRAIGGAGGRPNDRLTR